MLSVCDLEVKHSHTLFACFTFELYIRGYVTNSLTFSLSLLCEFI